MYGRSVRMHESVTRGMHVHNACTSPVHNLILLMRETFIISRAGSH